MHDPAIIEKRPTSGEIAERRLCRALRQLYGSDIVASLCFRIIPVGKLELIEMGLFHVRVSGKCFIGQGRISLGIH